MAKESLLKDRNFDSLAKRFKKNVYGGLKGDVRLAVLNRDCERVLPIAPFADTSTTWRVLDAGGGQGQFSLSLAAAGHDVVLCDISSEMLALAMARAEALGVSERITFIHGSLQTLNAHDAVVGKPFDLVICHAVMEWMHNPSELLPSLVAMMKPDAYLSLTFYNVKGLIFKNLLRTNFEKIQARDFHGSRGSLTPINPIDPADVFTWAAQQQLDVLCHSGIRVFHDYILEKQEREKDPEGLVAMELALSTEEPYRSLGRYIHLLCQRHVNLS